MSAILLRRSRRVLAWSVSGIALSFVQQDRPHLEENTDPKKTAQHRADTPTIQPSSSYLLSYVSPTAWYQYFFFRADEDESHFVRFLSSEDYESNPSGSQLMQWPSLIGGLKIRVEDEEHVRRKVLDAKSRIASSDIVDPIEKRALIERLSLEISEVMYGSTIDRAQRQEQLARYGCAKYTDEALGLIAKVAKDRGVVELGAGNGQWARALKERHNVDIIAFDSLADVPQPYMGPGETTRKFDAIKQYYGEVIKGDEGVFQPNSQFSQILNGRVLLLVYPGPGSMAMSCLKSYVSTSKLNDTLVYVGEGRGGANADERFFDWLESKAWKLKTTIPLEPFGSKGFERLFVFSRTNSR